MKACDAIKAKLIAAAATTTGSGSAGWRAKTLEDQFKRLGVGAIEEYAEFLPPGGKPDAIKKLYAGTPLLGGGSKGEKLMYALGAEFVEVRMQRADPRNPRAAHGRRLRRRPHHEYAHRAQPISWAR